MPGDIERYPFEFLDQVLWAMREATDGVLAVVDHFAGGKAQAAAAGPATHGT